MQDRKSLISTGAGPRPTHCILCPDVMQTVFDFAQGQLEAKWVASSGRLLESWPSYKIDNPWAGITRVCKLWRDAAAAVGFSARRYIAARRWSAGYYMHGTEANEVGQMYHWMYYKDRDMDIDWDIFHYIKGGRDGGYVTYNLYSDGPTSLYLVISNSARRDDCTVPANGKFPLVYKLVPGLIKFLRRGGGTSMGDNDSWQYGSAPRRLVADIARILQPKD
jgi:hypothetical protein